jgi:hypothetical protein
MAIDFPNSPSTNDQFTVGTTTWTYNGTAWVVSLGDASIATGAITADKIAASAVTTAKILDANVTAGKIASDAVITAKILDANVTAAKLASGAAVTNIGYTPANVAGPTFTGTVVLPSTTSIGTVSSTEIGYVDGVTSAIQTQLDSKLTATTAITSNRNAFINGAMNVWQRGTSTGTLPAGGGSYVGPDRWWYYNNGFTTSMSQQLCGATLPQFRNCLRVQRTSGQTSTVTAVLMSPQETINSVRFAGKNAILSFYARASSGLSSATALQVFVNTGTGTDQSNLGGGAYTGLATPIGLNPTLTTSWQRFSGTAAIASTTTEIGVQMNFTPTGTAGASDYFEITGIQLEEGSVATPFEHEDYSTTLAKCQRYYFRSTCNYLLGAVRDANLPYFTKQFPTTMRTTPSLSSNYNARAASLAPTVAGEIGFYGNGWYTGSGGTSLAADNGDPDQVSFYFTGWTGTAGQNLSLISNNLTWFGFTAEL